MKLKKLLAVLMTAILIVGTFTACGSDSGDASSDSDGIKSAPYIKSLYSTIPLLNRLFCNRIDIFLWCRRFVNIA